MPLSFFLHACNQKPRSCNDTPNHAINPPPPNHQQNQGQFIQGEHAAYDTAPQGDQFNYGAAPANTKGVAHV